MEEHKTIIKELIDYKGRILGGLLGFLAGLLWAFLGFWRALAFVSCLLLGYYIGKRIDQKESIKDIFNRVLPPKN